VLAPLILLPSATGASASAVSGHREANDQRIVFVVRTADVSRLYSIRADGSGLRLLSRLPRGLRRGGDMKPAWSPDGRWIAFARNLPRAGKDRVHLYVMRADGSGARRLTTGPSLDEPRASSTYTFDTMPTWAPDGRSIAFVRATGPAASFAFIHRVPFRGGPARKLTFGTVFEFAPAWSPDGRTLVFAGTAGANPSRGSLDFADASGTFLPLATLRPTGGPHNGTDFAWARNGSLIVYARFQQGIGLTCVRHGNPGRYILGLEARTPAGEDFCIRSAEIWRVNADALTGYTRLTRTTADDRHPSPSPDGARIVFSSGSQVGGSPPARLYTMPLDGGPRTLLFAPRRGAALDPAWGPAVP
jgi:Tol biopolymer transport system component